LVALREGCCYIDGYPFERGHNVVLMYKAPIPGSGTAVADIKIFSGFLNQIS
jgi:hypothetical protein